LLTLSAEDRAQLLAAALAALRLAVLVVSAALLDAAAVAVDGVALAALVVSAAEAVTLALVALVATEPPHAARDTPTAAVRPAPPSVRNRWRRLRRLRTSTGMVWLLLYCFP